MHRLKMRVKIIHANSNEKSAGVDMLISDKIDCKSKTVRDNELYYTMIKLSMHQEDTIIININIHLYQGTQVYKTNVDRPEERNR